MKINFFVGMLIYSLLNRIEVRFSFPKVVVRFVEATRVWSLRLMGANIGCGSFVRSHCLISTPEFLQIGCHSKLASFARLYLYAPFRIGDNVEIGSGLTVHTSEHIFVDKSKPLTKQGSRLAPVVIEDDVYIGSNVTIVSGVTIGSRVIVGAGAVVVKSLEGGWIYGGVPAKKIRPLSGGT